MKAPELASGLTASSTFVVGPADTAEALGSGALPVLATPRLLAWLESVTCTAIQPALDADTSSVGTRLSLEHLRPTAVGGAVTCVATLGYVDGRLLRFDVAATDQSGQLVAAGEITRVVVDEARFLARA
jgi:predicted thioesterase